ncbi:MAG: Uma2 family endonuclease [Symploca sp. SIO2E6]|nr:Uma2 family endonuclease [Symploca sp. SIO2E6]
MSVKVESSTKQVNPPCSPKEVLPTMYDLPSEDPEEPGLPDQFHLLQAQLCSATFQPPHYPSKRIFVASDLNLYYDPQNTNWYKRPDWFAVLGVSQFYQERELRLSYVMWQERVRPTVAIEFLSPSTRAEDLGETERNRKPPTKWEVYEQILRIPYYITFDRLTNELQAFQLVGTYYQKQALTQKRVWLPGLQLGLGLWQGEYKERDRQWLRWYDKEGNWILTDTEQESQRADRESQRAQRLAERLRQAGIDPDEIE